MIIQTGQRTDIPAFYSEWLCNRLREGYVCVRNPYNPTSITQYSLSADVVDLISFCTKNPGPMLSHMELLEPYGQYWFVTITPYGKDVEPFVPPKEKVIRDFQKLSGMVGVDSIGWRYDPIFIDDTYTLERHIADFSQMAAALDGYTKVCVISFLDLYKKVQRNFPEAKVVKQEERFAIGEVFAEIGAEHGMTIKACAEGNELAEFGVDCRGCMTMETYERALGCPLDAPKQKPSRAECACYLSCDIGWYDSCGHLCRYCYGNSSEESVRRNRKKHNPLSPLLIGEIQPEDKIHIAKQKSWVDRQLKLF